MPTEIKDGRGRRRVTTLLYLFFAKEASVGRFCKLQSTGRIPITGKSAAAYRECRAGIRSVQSSGRYFAAAILAPLINRVLSVSRMRVLIPVKADIYDII